MQVDKGRLLHTTLTRLSGLGEGEGVLLQPYKKDRSVCVIRRGEVFQILERGFLREEFVVEPAKLKKMLKVLCRREFPRSNKVWLNLLGAKEAASFAGQL